MAIFEALTVAIAEVTSFVVGKITGKVFKFEPQAAQRAGELIFVLFIAVFGLAVTLVYS